MKRLTAHIIIIPICIFIVLYMGWSGVLGLEFSLVKLAFLSMAQTVAFLIGNGLINKIGNNYDKSNDA